MPRRLLQVPVSLRSLVPNSSFVGCADIPVYGATASSGLCGPNMLFAAIPGNQQDGARFVSDAIDRGASSVLVEHPLADVSVPQCVVSNVRKTYAQLCAALAGHPSRYLNIAAVTGTNGKTTVTWLLRSILQAGCKQTGLLGTIEYSDGQESEPSSLTTPDAKDLGNWLSAMVARNTTHAAIEVSSHALDQDRPSGTRFDVAIVTNITQDHFDYHRDYESYRGSKARILEHCNPSACVVLNADDPGSLSIAESVCEQQLVTYGLHGAADVSATILDESLEGSRFVIRIGGEKLETFTPLVGRHNVSNCLAAAVAASQFDVSLDAIGRGIESLESVPGRLERVDCNQAFDVFVDYAHTDDALRRSIAALQEFSQNRVICVFGAGGDRDRSKRPLLGKAAAICDLAVVTSDNPRSEEPEQIIQDILVGFSESKRQPHVEVDRARAIRWALDHAEPGDCVLVAGKGHEVEQIIGTTRTRFVDREVIKEALNGPRTPIAARPVRVPA